MATASMPPQDIATIENELVLADLASVEKRLAVKPKRGKDPDPRAEDVRAALEVMPCCVISAAAVEAMAGVIPWCYCTSLHGSSGVPPCVGEGGTRADAA